MRILKLVITLILIVILSSSLTFAKSECESNKGYCVVGDICKEGYLNMKSAKYGCSETQNCCLPCVGENEEWIFGRIDQYHCCEGLTPLIVTKSYGYCTNCGDGVCSGVENNLTPDREKLCPQDCEIENKNFLQRFFDWLRGIFK